MKFYCKAHGRTADEVSQNARRQVEEFANGFDWGITEIEVTSAVVLGTGEVLSRSADVEAWVGDPE